MKHTVKLFTALLGIIAPLHAAELKLSGVFTDHMVLQREQAVPIWGWANPGEKVLVEFAGQKKTSNADSQGNWQVRLDPLAASAQGRDLKVGERVLKDVLVGDVWLCSGQSNMQFTMRSTDKAPAEIAAANEPKLRFFRVEAQFGQAAKADAQGNWQPVTPDTAAGCSAVAYYFGRAVQRKIGVPIGLLISSVGGTRIETWMRPETLAATGQSSALIEKWKTVSPAEFADIDVAYRAYQRERDEVHPQAAKAARAQGLPEPPAPAAPKLRCHDCPSALHNGMIAPLQPFAMRGAVWYQGESNSGQPAAYEKLLPALIADWRRVWGEELPFLFVQLAPHQSTHPAFREAQQRIWQNTPRTAMVVTTDVGDATNIHPTRKGPVGERLAVAARALVYGETVESSGPLFRNLNITGERAVLSFTHTGTGLVAQGETLKGFTVAGADGKFVPANAQIDGETVIVTSEKVAKPTAVRYNWAFLPDGNLFNREGLPAAPFRSDAPVRDK